MNDDGAALVGTPGEIDRVGLVTAVIEHHENIAARDIHEMINAWLQRFNQEARLRAQRLQMRSKINCQDLAETAACATDPQPAVCQQVNHRIELCL